MKPCSWREIFTDILFGALGVLCGLGIMYVIYVLVEVMKESQR